MDFEGVHSKRIAVFYYNYEVLSVCYSHINLVVSYDICRSHKTSVKDDHCAPRFVEIMPP